MHELNMYMIPLTIAFIALFDYKFTFKILHSYHNQCPRKTMKRCSTTASSKPKKHSKIVHKQPLTYQR